GGARSDLRGVGAKVLFEDFSAVADHERRDAGVAVFCRPRNQRKPADHLALYDIVERAARRGRALARQDLVLVPVKAAARADLVAALAGFGDGFADRAFGLACRGRPVQAVLLARAADDALRIDRHGIGLWR